MAGEYLKADLISDYWDKLKQIYVQKSTDFSEITKEEYEALTNSEREDSDNHTNEERLGQDTNVVDIAFYKYLPDRQVYYRVHIINVEGQ